MIQAGPINGNLHLQMEEEVIGHRMENLLFTMMYKEMMPVHISYHLKAEHL